MYVCRRSGFFFGLNTNGHWADAAVECDDDDDGKGNGKGKRGFV